MSSPGPVAAIDCGTNSIKVLIGRRRDDGTLDVLLRDSRVVRLGQGVDRTGVLADEALERTFAAIDELAETIRHHAVAPAHVRFCATSATRDASNADVFREGVRHRLGIEPEVLSGDEEAALVYAGAIAAQVPMPPEPVLVVDIGGGSTELVLGEADDRRSVSMDIGSVRLHERHLHTDPPTAAEVAACVADIDAHLDTSGVPLERTRTAIGTSGSMPRRLRTPSAKTAALLASRVADVAQNRTRSDGTAWSRSIPASSSMAAKVRSSASSASTPVRSTPCPRRTTRDSRSATSSRPS